MIPGVSSASPFFIRFTDCSDEQRETISQCWGLIFEMLDEFLHFSEQIQSMGAEIDPFPWGTFVEESEFESLFCSITRSNGTGKAVRSDGVLGRCEALLSSYLCAHCHCSIGNATEG